MLTETFFDTLLKNYEEEKGIFLEPEEREALEDFLCTSFDTDQLQSRITKKTAARILWNFLQTVCGEKPVDWGKAAKLKDIYDCKVCADAVAQVYVRGILRESRPGFFGMEDDLMEEELFRIINVVLCNYS